MNEKIINKRKRKISIITVGLVVMFLVIMSVITIRNITKTNALEYENLPEKISVKIDFNEYLEDESISESEKNETISKFDISLRDSDYKDVDSNFEFIEVKDGIAIYNISNIENSYFDSIYMEFYLNDRYNIVGKNVRLGWESYNLELQDGVEIYELKVEKAEKISVKIDFNEFLKDENFTVEEKKNEIENLSIELLENKDYLDNIISKEEYINLEKGIATYDLYIKYGDPKFIKFYSNDLPYDIYDENNNLLECDLEDKMDTESGDYVEKDVYLLNIDEIRDMYNFKVESLETVKIQIDFNEFLGDESFTDEEKKTEIKNIYLDLKQTKIEYNEEFDYEYETLKSISRVIKFAKIEDGIAKYYAYLKKGNFQDVKLYLSGSTYDIYDENNNILQWNTEREEYILNMHELQDVYKFKVKKPEKSIKIDFTEFIEDENFSEEFKEKYINELKIYLYEYDYYDRKVRYSIRFNNIEDGIAIYDIYLKGENPSYVKFYLNYLPYDMFKNDSMLEITNMNSRKYYVSEITDLNDIYKLKPKENEYRKLEMNFEYGESILQSKDVLENANILQDGICYDADLLFKSDNKVTLQACVEKNREFKIEIYTYDKVIYNDVELDSYNDCYYLTVTLDNNNDVYDFEIERVGTYSDIQWNTLNTAKLKIFSNSSFYYYDSENGFGFYSFIKEELDYHFKLSNEYENNPDWLITTKQDIESYDVRVEENRIAEFLYNNRNKNIYIKDTNEIYLPKAKNLKEINLVYNDCDIEDTFTFYTYGYFIDVVEDCGLFIHGDSISILGKKEIRKGENKKANVTVSKLVNEGEDGTYYVGVFNTDNEEMTDKIYDINVINGKGSTTIKTDTYFNEEDLENCYIYEVDKDGKKINSNRIKYNKNRVLENIEPVEKDMIESDNEIRSILLILEESEDINDINNVNNVILKTKTYEDSVVISPREQKVLLVKYETEEGGILIGDTEEAVKEGEKPIKVPEIKEKDDYEFIKWVIIKDGEEIEVNPREYVVLEDTTFIAKHKRIEKEEKIEEVDTSDIDIWKNVGVCIISVIVIAIMYIMFNMNKKKNNSLN